MPNQRKAGTKLVGAYVEDKEHKRLKAEAKRRGMSVADLVRELVKEYNRRHAGELKETPRRGNNQ